MISREGLHTKQKNYRIVNSVRLIWYHLVGSPDHNHFNFMLNHIRIPRKPKVKNNNKYALWVIYKIKSRTNDLFSWSIIILRIGKKEESNNTLEKNYLDVGSLI